MEEQVQMNEKLRALLEKAKREKKIASKDLIDTLEAIDADEKQTELIYEALDEAGVEIDVSDVVELLSKPEEMLPSEEDLELIEEEKIIDTEDLSENMSLNDPVRMYLREMGAVPLLDRDGEVVIAKKIEMGEQDVLYALVEVPVAVEELINVGEDLRQNRIKLKDVVKTIEEDDPSEDELNQRSRVILLLDEIKQIFKKKRKIYKKLDDCGGRCGDEPCSRDSDCL